MKKFLSLVLVLVLLAGIAPAVLAAGNADYAAVRAELSPVYLEFTGKVTPEMFSIR